MPMTDAVPHTSVFDTIEPVAATRKPKLKTKFYEEELKGLQAELVKLQSD